MADLDTVLQALAEIRRHQILAAKANPATQDLYSDAYVHAILHSVCPAFHEDPAEFGIDSDGATTRLPFQDTYEVPARTVLEIASFLDERSMAGETVTYRDLESRYRDAAWPGTYLRNDLINICRYLFLRSMLGPEFWRAFLVDAPTEALDIGRKWTRDELVMWSK